MTWTYSVSNPGTAALNSVLVEDHDADGKLVFSHTIPSLAAGASVTLEADGVAIAGQYRNTVTVTAADPIAAGELVAADDSYYFGVAAGITPIPGPEKTLSRMIDGTTTVEETGATPTAKGIATQSADLARTGASSGSPFVLTLVFVLLVGAGSLLLMRRMPSRA
ncbi:hypothetical protein G7066_04435 [Leucobacter coleopterorum]|uniref:LPXTG-motif cell wall anchor domain-containing protein n=1 Tax=Leucobacter coleopterorum TaxID=2714933 RepID=A0ABX6JV02_9MICO|nr:hypothetical protein [Leucobacter coleopterorum]QIM18092.1 hypothetical protein G7066_04435 [Leucobacter coleopterorum]